MPMNTTKSVKRTSNVLGEKTKKTQENMKKLMLSAGCKEYKTVKTMIPMMPGSEDDVVFVGLNGVGFWFMRGHSVDVPEPLLRILHQCGVV